MTGLIRQGHLLGPKLRNLRKRHGLTLDELSSRCVQRDPVRAPSISYLSMVETGKRIPSTGLLGLLADVFGKEPRWFLDGNIDTTAAPIERSRAGATGMALEPSFLFSRDLLQSALPELLAQTGTNGRQFAQLLIRVWQENRQNDFPDIERAAEEAGKRQLPLSLARIEEIAAVHGLQIRWIEVDRRAASSHLLRARFEAPGTIWVNPLLRRQQERLKYELAFFIGHRILHNGDGVISPHTAAGLADEDTPPTAQPGMGTQDVLLAWRDFECSVFAGALLCPKAPFRQFLARESHQIFSCNKLGVTPAVVMRRMTAVSPYRHWHFFDGYPPGYLRAVYRGNGIPLPWGNMSLVPDPCPRWAVFRLLHQTPPAKSVARQPVSQISVMQNGPRLSLYCCHSLLTRDAADTMHVLSVGVDLAPALDAQGFNSEEVTASIAESCRRGGGEGVIPQAAATQLANVAQVLNIAWIAEALASTASIICPRSGTCPRQQPCAAERKP
jgi:transcriptional regulator with XRE-family HTH domain